MPSQALDIRCPVGPRRLLMRVLASGETPHVDRDDNLLELACADCRRIMRKEGTEVNLVLHRFNILGELIETVTQ